MSGNRRYPQILAAEHFAASILILLILMSVAPSTASALGVAGFDLYRPGVENPDSAFHFDLKPGQSKVERVILKNTSETVQNVHIYVADAMPTSNGGIALRERLDKKTGLSRWIKIDSPEELSLEPGEKRRIKFKVSVPDFSETDEKMAGLIVERAEPMKSGEGQQFQINIVPRAAILISQRLPGPAIERLKIVDFDRSWTNRNIVFKLALKNTGNIHLRPKAKIHLYDMFGRRYNTIKIGRMATVFPGMITRVSPVWQHTPAIGYFTAEADVEYGKNKSENRTITILIFPWWVLPIILALWIIARQQRKRRAARKKLRLEDEKEIAAAAALETLNETVDSLEKEPVLPISTKSSKVRPATRAMGIPSGEVKDVKAEKPASARTEKKIAATATKKTKKATKKSTTKKTTGSKASAGKKKSTTKKSTTKKTAGAKASAGKKKSTTKKTGSKRSTAPKTSAVAKKSTAKRTTTKKSTTKKGTTKKRAITKKTGSKTSKKTTSTRSTGSKDTSTPKESSEE